MAHSIPFSFKQIIADAYNFRHETIERQMNENGEL
jgi:hypothetical protein